MAKRNLRVVKWLRTVPGVGVCTGCNREFKASVSDTARVADAQASLRRQFTEHTCNPHNVTEPTAPISKVVGKD